MTQIQCVRRFQFCRMILTPLKFGLFINRILRDSSLFHHHNSLAVVFSVCMPIKVKIATEKKAERNFEITASIQETLNTSDTLFFDVTIMESSLSASGNLTAVFQFNDLNLRLDLNKEYKEPTSIRVTLVNWVITEVIENETPINDYQITASKGINTNSGVIISADACGADLYAEASLVISHFELSYPKWTID
jgi:hypothetical protein